ncbi:hypothetical protein [Tychonema sp. LEGE 07203]|uniref:hypothetical protein n=1 Tax=Tychonema sp. LEGE 07203 TaxID=1828671 RepID=UPI001D157DEF|nr:hypothetical protein [Tychonema sp. LEGE 07203]
MAGVGFFAGFGGGGADFVAVLTAEVSGFLGTLSKLISLILLQKSCSDFLKLSISICRAACLISGVAKGVEAKLLRNKDKLESIKVRITEVTISKISLSFIRRRKKEEGRRKKEEGRRKREEGRRKREEGRSY